MWARALSVQKNLIKVVVFFITIFSYSSSSGFIATHFHLLHQNAFAGFGKFKVVDAFCI